VVTVEEVVCELGNQGVGLGRVVDAVDASDGLLGVPREAHLAAWVTGFEQSEELGFAPGVEASWPLVRRRRDR
jgi:hypothetical protein